MKNRRIPFLLGCGMAIVFAHSLGAKTVDSIAGKVLTSSITKVTVYTDRAMVTREATDNLAVGEHTLVFGDLPEALVPQSIQLTGKGDAIVKDIKVVQRRLARISDAKRKEVLDKLTALQDSMIALDDRLSQSNAERIFLENITKRQTAFSEKSETSETDPDKWIKMVGYYRTRLNDLNAEVRAITKTKRDLQREVDYMLKIAADQNVKATATANTVEVLVMQKNQGEVRLSLSYIVVGPSWKSQYDLRVATERKSMAITYNARVRQNTGEEWDRCAVQLSTAQPNAGGKQPDLTPWHLSFSAPYTYSESSALSKRKSQVMMNMMPAPSSRAYESVEEEKHLAPTIEYQQAAVESKATSVVYSIPGNNSIASDNQEHSLAIATIEFPAQFRYSTAPKLSPCVYLKAKVANKSDFMLLAGPTNIFLNNNFVATASLENTVPGEEFWTFLGVDNALLVEQKLLRRYASEEGVFGKRTRMVYDYQIEVTNNKKSAEEVVVWDQIPISNNEEIKIELIKPQISDKDPAIKKNEQNYIEWLVNLKPGEKRKIPFSFAVEHPRDRMVYGL